ncbi:MAG: ribosomal RNA small subunit methyltransferase A [Chloroflexi bacterium]|nr:ribosomal RNA small subunit methyltransferase A [Chloroflexota bacterium]
MVDVRRLLKEFDIRPKKSLGQNFLTDQRALECIVEAAELGGEDVVLEIGPGLGTLTRVLAERAGKVIAVELDQRLVGILSQTLADLPNVEIVHGDILQLDPAELIRGAMRPCGLSLRAKPCSPAPLLACSSAPLPPYKVVANLPYYITSAILRHFLTGKAKPRLMVVTVQLEVARRITAEPGDMSLLAVSVQFYGRPRIVARIKASAFYPSPQVDSAVIRIDVDGHPVVEVDDADSPSTSRRGELVEPSGHSFFEVVRAGFAQRRKQLRNALAAELALPASEVAQALSKAGVNPGRRAQTLSIAEWARVWSALRRVSPPTDNPSCPGPLALGSFTFR